MGKKIYAVKKGRTIGFFDNWEECQASVIGFSGAVYRGFPDRKSAEKWLRGDNSPCKSDSKVGNTKSEYQYKIYCDGSYDAATKNTGYGIVVLKDNEVIYTRNDSSYDEYDSGNITGEIFGTLEALAYCKEQNITGVEIFYDYAGIECWANGSWAANKTISKRYVNELQTTYKGIDIKFTKIQAHSGVEHNELADKLAKEAVKRANSVSLC